MCLLTETRALSAQGEKRALVGNLTMPFVSRKAVITCVDSGGPAELVRPDQDGLVVEPDPASLANAFRRVMDDDVLAERLGAAAEARARDFTWERTIPRLLVG